MGEGKEREEEGGKGEGGRGRERKGGIGRGRRERGGREREGGKGKKDFKDVGILIANTNYRHVVVVHADSIM